MKTFILFLIILLTPTICFAKLNETTWSPDTCGCVIVYEWDDSLPSEERIHTFKRADKVCAAHLSGSPNKMAVVLEENQRKNIVFGEIKKINTDLKPEEFHFRFNDQRKLIVSSPGLEKSNEGALEVKVGGDKVDVE